ncbi:MAG: DUF4123 domain-containing protein [Bryobacteraceae bacterium]
MRVVLEILDGPLAGRTVELAPGESVSVGRTAKSQLMLPHDNFLSGMHFLVENTPGGVVLRDCNSSNGTWVNGDRVNERPVSEGDQISAGQTRFRLYSEAADDVDRRSSTVLFAVPKFQEQTGVHSIESLSFSTEQQRVLDYFRQLTMPLYAMLNAGIEQHVPHFLMGSGEPFQFLSEGLAIDQMQPPLVYLAQFTPSSTLLPRLIKEGWGKPWITFFTSLHPVPELTTHLRNLMVVSTPDGRPFYNRFYDPRLLQLLLPSYTPQEVTQLFGPLLALMIADPADASRLLEFAMTPQGPVGRALALR